jgi:hypothetical protein
MDLVTTFCEFPEMARRSRRSLVTAVADDKTLYMSAHFPLSSAGRISRVEDGYHWSFVDTTAR